MFTQLKILQAKTQIFHCYINKYPYIFGIGLLVGIIINISKSRYITVCISHAVPWNNKIYRILQYSIVMELFSAIL